MCQELAALRAEASQDYWQAIHPVDSVVHISQHCSFALVLCECVSYVLFDVACLTPCKPIWLHIMQWPQMNLEAEVIGNILLHFQHRVEIVERWESWHCSYTESMKNGLLYLIASYDDRQFVYCWYLTVCLPPTHLSQTHIPVAPQDPCALSSISQCQGRLMEQCRTLYFGTRFSFIFLSSYYFFIFSMGKNFWGKYYLGLFKWPV